MKYFLIVLIICVCVLSVCVHSANILGVFTAPSISHQMVFQPIWKELSLRGHNVTVITPNPLKDPTLTNLTEIDISFLYEARARLSSRRDGVAYNHWRLVKILVNLGVLGPVLESEEVQKLLKSNAHFDVVLAETIQPGNSVFSAIYDCPLVAVMSLDAPSFIHRSVGNPTHPVLYPDFMVQFDDPPSFFERMDSLFFHLWQEYFYEYTYFPSVDKIIKKHFGENMPSLSDMEKNISLLLVNTNPILHKPRPFTHGVIELGGMNIQSKKPLPQNLKSYLDNATKGVIYFSLGSNIKSVNLGEYKLNLLLEVFSELPYKVLWKFENDSLTNKPQNVEISRWFPQQDVFRHPNVKLFITQGGLQSLEEAIYNDVPLLALPIVADQHPNARRISYLGIGKHLDFYSMSKKEFREAILEVASNPRYKENVVKIHDLLQDRPMTGLQTAIWWIEYVIRHRGTPYFDSPLAKISWTQYLMVDVVAFLLACILVAIYLLFKIINLILLLRPGTQRKEKKL